MTLRLPVRGLLLLAMGRVEGLAEFGEGSDAYLASLAPFVALALVGSGVVALAGAPRTALLVLLRQVCLLLAPAVEAELFCLVWRRPGVWLRYATVLNWALWLEALLFGAVLVLGQSGVVPPVVALGLTMAAPLYLLAFHWFVARRALSISHGRVALLLGVNLLVSIGIVAASLYGVSRGELAHMIAPPAASGSENGSGS